MSFEAEIDDFAAEAAQKAEEAIQGGDFPPLPRGPYQAQIIEFLGIENLTDDVNKANYGKKVAVIRVAILDGSPLGRLRQYRIRIPLFSRFAPNPNGSNEEAKTIGSSARMFWNFFEKVMQVPRQHIIEKKPLPSDLVGKFLTIILGSPKKPDQWNPLGSNDVDGVEESHGNFEKTPVLNPTVPVAAWLTVDNVLIPDHPSLGQRGPQAGPGIAGPSQGIAGPAGPIAGPAAPIAGPGAPVAGPGFGAPQQQFAAQAQPQQQYATGGAFPGQVIPQGQPQQFAAPGGFQAPQAPGAPLQQPAQVQVPDTVPAQWAGANGPAQAAAQQVAGY